MGWVVNATSRPLYLQGKTRYPLCRRLDRPQGLSGRVRKISPPPKFDLRTVQPVPSRYTGPLYGQTYLLNGIGLTPSGSSTVHIYTQTIRGTTQLIWEECGPYPVFASYTLAFALQLRKKHGKTSVRVAEECQLAR